MQSVAELPCTTSSFFGHPDGLPGSLTRAAAKRASQDEEMDHSKKRAAFVDITNQHSEHDELDKPGCADQHHGAAAAYPSQFQNPFYAQDHSNGAADALPGRVTYANSALPPSAAARQTYVDIDAPDADDPLACTTYIMDIFAHLRESEALRRPDTTYMESVQTDINPVMRSILVDWLVEVGQEYRLTSDTLFLSVALVDRYLSLVDVKRNRLQLVGITCMLVAAKYEEIYAPQVEEFCYITDNTYNREQVLAMEREVLGVLEFDITQPTIKTFLRRYIKAASGEIQLDASFEFLASYLAEMTLMEYGMLGYLPSQIAASAVLLALFMLGKPTWSNTLAYYSGYTPRDLRQCTEALHALFLQSSSSNLPASRDKYSSPKFCGVAQLGVMDILPERLYQFW